MSRLLVMLPLALLAGCKSPKTGPDLVDIQKYTIPAERGDAWGQYKLGQAYQTHWKPATANDWYRKAALNGQPDAMYALGLNYQNGNGINKDLTEALAWFNIGASQNQLAARNARESLIGKLTAAEVEAGNRRAAELGAQIPARKLIYEDAKVSPERAAKIAEDKQNVVAATGGGALGYAMGEIYAKSEEKKYFTSTKPEAVKEAEAEQGSNPDRTSYPKGKPMRKSSAPAPAKVEPAKPAAAKPAATAKPTSGSSTNSPTELKPVTK